MYYTMVGSKKNKKVDDGTVMELQAVDGITGGENPEAGLQEPEVPCGRKREHLYMVHAEQFRNIFPEETWVRILNKVDPEDQGNWTNASPYFWELLQKQRTVFLLPKVIDIMALVFEQNYDIRKVSTSEEGDGVASSGESLTLTGTLNHTMNAEEWKQTVLKCRLVCSTWNTAVENCYQKPEMTGIPEYVEELHPKLNNLRGIQWTKLRLSVHGQPREVRQLLEQFEESHHSGVRAPPKNPFLGRYLCIKIELYLPAYFNNVKEIMNKFGKEIWYLEVFIGGPAYRNLHLFKNLRRWLRLVPNLKFLQIHSEFPIALAHVASQSGQNRDSPLPTFEKLEILSLKNLGPQIGSDLLRKNCHVVYLKIDKTDFDEDVKKSLEMLNLKGFSVVDSPSGEQMLENYAPIWKNIKKLCFGVSNRKYPSCHSVRPSFGIRAPEAFSIFQNNWAETLTDLQLQFPFGFDEKTVLEQSKALRLNLPGVRRLTLRDFPCVFLDFALPLKNSLEHLVLQFEIQRDFCQEHKYSQRVKREQTIQLVGFEDRMQMSNIWEIFGKLKTVKVVYYMGSNGNNYHFTLFTKEKEKFDYSRRELYY